MIPLNDLRLQILDYKKTSDPKLFAEILANVDYLLLYYINKGRKRFAFTRKQSLTDLYHTSIIALHKFLTTYPDNWRETHIPCRLQAYIYCEFKSTYDYLSRETSLKYSPVKRCIETNLHEIDYKLLLEKLSKKDSECLNHYVMKTKSITQIAQEEGISVAAVSLRIKSIIKSLKAELTNETKDN